MSDQYSTLPSQLRWVAPPATFHPERPAWQQQGACLGHNPDLFFPERGEREQAREAKAVCAACPVKAECLAFALDTGLHYGIWGGTSERERQKLRRKKAAA